MKKSIHPKGVAALSTSVFAALFIVGCGGGGGGGGGSSTTTSTTSSTTGTIYSANSIVYGTPSSDGSTFSLNQVKPDGTSSTTLISGVSGGILLFAQIPNQKNQFVIFADLTGAGSYGIYLSTGLSVNGTTTLVSPVYGPEVTSLSISADGKHVIYSASLLTDPTLTGYLFSVPITGGTPVQLDFSDGSTISPSDSNTIAYVASPGGTANFDQVFTRSLSAGATGKPIQLTTDSTNHLLPAFDRSGTKLAYWESTTLNTLMIRTLGSNATPISLPNPTQIVPQGESFNSDGSQVVIASDANGSGEFLTQATTGSANPTVIFLSSQLLGNYGVYWTDTSGRGGTASLMPSVARKRVGLPFFLHQTRSG